MKDFSRHDGLYMVVTNILIYIDKENDLKDLTIKRWPRIDLPAGNNLPQVAFHHLTVAPCEE